MAWLEKLRSQKAIAQSIVSGIRIKIKLIKYLGELI